MDELAVTGWDDDAKEAFIAQQFRAQSEHYRRHYPEATFDVIVVDGAPAGRLYVARWDDEIRVMDIALLPEHRGKGVGGDLLEALLAEASRTGKKVSIHVERTNPAMGLYERLGFTPIEERGIYWLMETTPATSGER
jgi:GNAT superfamily N-acetyltransferase